MPHYYLLFLVGFSLGVTLRKDSLYLFVAFLIFFIILLFSEFFTEGLC